LGRAGAGGFAALDGEYPPGTYVYHDDYGAGVVVKSFFRGVNEVVLVRFETGFTGQFIPKYTPLERISGDF
jgi:DNA helicase-2/ATP-dependent DNA helicase PcrA